MIVNLEATICVTLDAQVPALTATLVVHVLPPASDTV